MSRFTFENQGANTYLVYGIGADESIDSLSLGMITNNKISGILPVVFTQMDDNKFFKYTISSKISVKQFFSGTVNKKRLLGVFYSIATGILNAEEYMIEASSLVFDLEYIYADVSTCEAWMVCLPIINTNAEPVDLSSFFKNIMFSTQFDQTENCDYVARIISYLNSTSLFSLVDFKRIVDELLRGVQQKNVKAASSVQNAKPQIIEQQQQSTSSQSGVFSKPAPTATAPNISAVQQKQGALQTPVSQKTPSAPKTSASKISPSNTSEPKTSMNVGFAVPGMSNVQTGPKKESTKKEKIKKEKPQKEKKGLFSFFTKKKTNAVQPPVPENNQNGLVQQPAYEQQAASYQNIPNNKQGMPAQQAPKLNFGETTVLGGLGLDQTTVLGGGEALMAKPFIIRSKNNEKIYLDKVVFRIGKEKSYVDYFISDNSAVSRSHANIIIRDNDYYVVDTNSTNHTYVDGVMIQSNTEIKIDHGAKLRFANEEFEFRLY